MACAASPRNFSGSARNRFSIGPHGGTCRSRSCWPAAAADRCEQRGPCGELYSIGDDGLPHDEWLHAELLGNEDDDPFAYDFDEFVNMSRDEQEEFLRKRETGWTDKRDDTK